MALLGLAFLALAGTALPIVVPVLAADPPPPLDPALVERMTKEKEARKACEVDLCKAFAHPETSAPIACDITKTWSKDEILSKIVGGSYIWGYGHMQCNVKLGLDKTVFGKAVSEPSAVVTLPAHKVDCTIDDKDPAKGAAFKVDVNVSPKVTFEKGKAKSVDFGKVTTEGSTIASAAVKSLMAADALAGVVSKAASTELNGFFFTKCKEVGIEITPQP